ncbi:MAG: alpha/beta fold hydrolase [Lautropia sp.]
MPTLPWPPIVPFASESIDVGEGHALHLAQCGAPAGRPVLLLHGGPGAGYTSAQLRLFDPARYRTIVFDQRGCARSRPRGEIRANDTSRLVADIERIRARLGITRWIVYGGSWGASLAIAWAAAHRDACEALILRAPFLTGDADLDWFFGGAGALLPDRWASLSATLGLDLDPVRPGSGLRVLARLCTAMLDDPGPTGCPPALACAAWAAWEAAVSRPGAAADPSPAPSADDASTVAPAGSNLIDYYRVQAHYLRHRCFLGEAALIGAAGRLAGLEVHILQGRLDWICRPINAFRLAAAIHGARLHWAAQGGHSQFDAPMLEGLATAMKAIESGARSALGD